MKVYMDDIRCGPIYNPSTYDTDNDWVIARSVEMVKQILMGCKVTHLSLDHDMGENVEDGYDLVKWMVEKRYFPTQSLTIHSANPVGVENMKKYLESAHKAMPELRLNKICDWIK